MLRTNYINGERERERYLQEIELFVCTQLSTMVLNIYNNDVFLFPR